jgi:antitoxin (DNA-binding transcriptional repressor) of toxin-antitoxin stability system
MSEARCLELMDRVREAGAEYTITKHGRPVARLVPCKPPGKPRRLFGSMKGTVLGFDRPPGAPRLPPTTSRTVGATRSEVL